MRGKKYVIIISLLIFLVSILVFSVVVFSDGIPSHSCMTEWIKALTSGMMTSSIVTLLISIGEYYVEKRRTIETFFEIERKLLARYKELNYIENLKNKAEDKDLVYDAINQYRGLCNMDLSELGNAYAAIDYLFINKKVRPILYKQIIVKLEELNRLLSDFQFYLKHYDRNIQKTDIGYEYVLLDKIDAIQGNLFRVEQNNNRIVAYKEFCFNVDMVAYHEFQRLYGRSYNYPMPEHKEYLAYCRLISFEESKKAICDATGKEELL